MGADFWECYTDFKEDLSEALMNAQIEIFNKGTYFSSGSITDEIESLEEAIELTKENDVGFDEDTVEHLLEQYTSQLKRIKSMPEPKSTQEKIDQIRELNCEEGTKSIIDITGISTIPELGKATPIKNDHLVRIFNTEKPTYSMIEENKDKLAELCDRLMAICVIAYEDETPKKIFFAGYSGD